MLSVNMTRVAAHATCWLVEPGDRLRQAREAANLSRAALAERSGYSVSGIGALENGQNNIKPDAAELLAKIVGTSPEWILYGRASAALVGQQVKLGQGSLTPAVTYDDPRPELTHRQVKLVGYVGAGAAAHYYAGADDPNEFVDAPEDVTDKTVAVEIRGESLGALFESWLVYYDEVRSPVTPDLYNRLCVVGLPDDRVLVKRIRKARTEGLFHLDSNTEPTMNDVEIAWAARVKTMRPR